MLPASASPLRNGTGEYGRILQPGHVKERRGETEAVLKELGVFAPPVTLHPKLLES